MWVFYLISLPLTLGMVAFTLGYFAGPTVPRYVRYTVGYTWFCSLSIIILVPADIWTTIIDHDKRGISFFWSWSYWSTFLLTWAVVPTIQGYEDAGDFTVTERLKTSVRANLFFHLCVSCTALCGLILLILLSKDWSGSIVGFAMACSNTFGLVTGAFLLGFGLSEIPKGIWKDADWTFCQKVLSHKVAKMALKLDDAHQEFSNAIVIAQATSKQMSKRDTLRPYMNVIDKMLLQMLSEDPSFKPQGGRLGENDMDYDTDEKTMAALRRQLRRARDGYYRYKSEYTSFVAAALELEDTIKNYDHCSSNGWKYISSLRSERTGKLGSLLDIIELVWRCMVKDQLKKVLAIMLGCMSAAILLAEATIFPNGVDLSLFSKLIKAVKTHEVLVQVAAFVPLMYMCVCTYYSLFRIGMLTFYSLTQSQTSSVSLLMICSMVARYAAPISYNFLNLIHLPKDAKTIFEKRMGNIDDAVPFFGRGFNRIYPLIMVIYTILIMSNFFNRAIEYLGNWKLFKLQNEADDSDGFDPSGLIILQRERSWIEQGHEIGEVVIPLARSFSNANLDLESGRNNKTSLESNGKLSLVDNEKRSSSKPFKTEAHNVSSEGISRKYTAIRTQEAYTTPAENNTASSTTSLNDGAAGSKKSIARLSSGLASTLDSMKTGFRNFKTNIGLKKFLPLRQVQDSKPFCVSSSESLDEIFEKLKRPAVDHRNYDSDDDNLDDSVVASSRGRGDDSSES